MKWLTILIYFSPLYPPLLLTRSTHLTALLMPSLVLSKDDIPLISLSDSPVTATEIIEATNLLQGKKTLGLFGIPVWLTQKIITNISAPLKHIFATSFSLGIVPSQFKIAKVVPVFKSGNKESMDNYPPISLLSCFSKIIEKIVGSRLTAFLDTNNLISKAQYGFRKKHSTIHPLIHFIDHVSTALDKKEHTLAIFCDLRKAFDTVNHQILISKLHQGVGAELVSGLSSEQETTCTHKWL